MGVVVFNPTAFKAAYPEFAAVPDSRLEYFFEIATCYLSNEPTSLVQNLRRREVLLWLLTAHIGALAGVLTNSTGASSSQPVGRLNSARQGSVETEFDFANAPATQQWFIQTQYGAAYWQATIYLRSARYLCRPTLINYGFFYGYGFNGYHRW